VQPNNSLRFAPPGNTIPDGVRVVPDPERAGEAPVNRAPQLLDPHDRSAAAASLDRWAVVPAVWPTKRASHAAAARVIEAQPSRNLNERTDFATTSSHVPSRPGLTTVERTAVTESWDDSGWSSGR
jgi:hypothetical protein